MCSTFDIHLRHNAASLNVPVVNLLSCYSPDPDPEAVNLSLQFLGRVAATSGMTFFVFPLDGWGSRLGMIKFQWPWMCIDTLGTDPRLCDVTACTGEAEAWSLEGDAKMRRDGVFKSTLTSLRP